MEKLQKTQLDSGELARERFALMNQPYIKIKEMETLTGKSYPTIKKALDRAGVYKHPLWGYVTDDVLRAFKLQPYYDRLAAVFGEARLEA